MNSKQDVHILDWDLITKDRYNSKRQKNSSESEEHQINKGILFEDLVEKIISAMFPMHPWRRTIKSHDGKRDFVYPQNEFLPEQKWAECKNYESHISLNVIAPTLIMGAIENIRAILFFSYSFLNDNAVEGILRYAESTGKDVQIFDGNLLESLICKYQYAQGIGDYFPYTDFENATLRLEGRPLRVIKTLRTLNGSRLSPTHLFELGESFSISIIVQNLSLEQIEYKLSLKLNPHCSLSPDSYEMWFSLPGAAIKEHKIVVQALKPGSIRYTVVIEPHAKNRTIDKIRRHGIIKVVDEQYLFWTGSFALDAQKMSTAHLAAYQTAPLLISAPGGTGKSTLINILLQDAAVQERYTILQFDLNQSRNCCIRNILSQILGIHNTDSTPDDQVEDDQMALNLLINSYAESAAAIAEIVIKYYNSERPYLIVIDDLQKIGRAYIDLINELFYCCEKANHPIYCLLALNEDISSQEDMLMRLNWDAAYLNRACTVIKLGMFDQKDILAFLKHKFGLINIEQFFEGFDESIRPIELRSFSINIRENHIISPFYAASGTRKVYQVVDELRFTEAVNTVLYKNRSIKTVCELLTGNDIPLYVLKYLCVADEMKADTQRKYERAIHYLISLGLVKEVNERIIFCHEEIRSCIKESLSFSEEDYVDIYCDPSVDETAKAICALNQLGKLRGSTKFLKGFFRADREITKSTQRFDLCQLVFEKLDELSTEKLIADALHFVRFHFDALNHECGYITSCRLLKQAAESALSGTWDGSAESVDNMAYFVKKYFDRALSTRNYQHCIEYYPQYEAVFKKISYTLPLQCNYWLSHYTNRLAIMCDRSSTPLEIEPLSATKYYQQSQEYCVKAGEPDTLRLQLCVDEFNRHYVYRHDLTPVLVDQTYCKLNDIDRSALPTTTSLDYHLLLLEYLQITFCGYNQSSETLIHRIQCARTNSTSPFYCVKLYILESYILIEHNQFDEVGPLLSQALSLAYRSEMRHHIYKLTYIKAYLQIFQLGGEVNENAYGQLLLAFEQLMDTRGESAYDLKREIYLVRQLVSFIFTREPDRVKALTERKSQEVQSLLQIICNGVSNPHMQVPLLSMPSYYVYNNVSFPSI